MASGERDGLHTAADVYHGRVPIRALRASALTAAYAEQPERFARKPPDLPNRRNILDQTRPRRKRPPLTSSRLAVPHSG